MNRSSRFLASAALSFVLFAPQAAEARFGKRDDPPPQSSCSSSTSSSNGTHRAVPVSAPSYSSDDSGGHQATAANAPTSTSGHHHGSRHFSRYRYGRTCGYYPYFAFEPLPLDSGFETHDPGLSSTFDFGFQVHGEGIALGGGFAIEGKRLGLHAQATAVMLETGLVTAEGATDVDLGVALFDAHLTWALLSGPNGRLRLEGGISSAIAPDLSVLGPDVGVSGTLGIVGPLGVEASTHYTVWPYQRLRLDAGATLAFGPFGIRGGWRHLYLDDGGVLGDADTDDSFSGPFFSVNFMF